MKFWFLITFAIQSLSYVSCCKKTYTVTMRQRRVRTNCTKFAYWRFLEQSMSKDTSVQACWLSLLFDITNRAKEHLLHIITIVNVKPPRAIPDGMTWITLQQWSHSPELYFIVPKIIFDEQSGLKLCNPAGQIESGSGAASALSLIHPTPLHNHGPLEGCGEYSSSY